MERTPRNACGRMTEEESQRTDDGRQTTEGIILATPVKYALLSLREFHRAGGHTRTYTDGKGGKCNGLFVIRYLLMGKATTGRQRTEGRRQQRAKD